MKINNRNLLLLCRNVAYFVVSVLPDALPRGGHGSGIWSVNRRESEDKEIEMEGSESD